MENYNKVVFVGNATDEPKQFTTKNNKMIVAFSLAVNRFWRGQDGKLNKEVDFHRIVAFGKWADYVSGKIHKGNPLLIEGQIVNRSFDDKEGKRQYRTEVRLQKLKFLGQSRVSKKQPESMTVSVEEAQPA